MKWPVDIELINRTIAAYEADFHDAHDGEISHPNCWGCSVLKEWKHIRDDIDAMATRCKEMEDIDGNQ